MEYFVYILRCKDGSYYTGITWNLNKRLMEHNDRVRSCLQKSKVPAELVWWEKLSSRNEAAKKEKEIKGWSRVKKENLINSGYARVVGLR